MQHFRHPSSTSPEWVNSLSPKNPGGAVDDPGVGLVQAALLDHLILVLDQQLHPLYGSSNSLGDPSSHAGQHEALEESKFLVSHLERLGLVQVWSRQE